MADDLADDLGHVSEAVREELARRVMEIESGYRAIAEKMGQLYMRADEHELASLTRSLDRPMRNASDNERALGAILEELTAAHPRRGPRRTP